jgi:hypothetical protein
MLSVLLANRVDFVVVGAYAMAAHGYPRATGDIDLFIHPTPENAGKVIAALKQFGAPLNQVTASDFEKPGTVFQIGVAPRRIDIITEIDGVSFAEAFKERIIISMEELDVPVISRRLLIANKKATGREKDRLDADSLRSQK